jgi:hypothetical protein
MVKQRKLRRRPMPKQMFQLHRSCPISNALHNLLTFPFPYRSQATSIKRTAILASFL